MRRHSINFLYNPGHVIRWCLEVVPVANAREGSKEEHDWARVRMENTEPYCISTFHEDIPFVSAQFVEPFLMKHKYYGINWVMYSCNLHQTIWESYILYGTILY